MQKIIFTDYTLRNGVAVSKLILSYQWFGQSPKTAPVVLVNHALTGNSQVAGANGWWNSLVGNGKVIDTDNYAVLAFNITGNGYNDSENIIENYKDFTNYDIASLFWKGIDLLEITNLYAIIGGSLGGAVAWEMAVQRPDKIQHLIPIATSSKSSDWLIGNILIQDTILNHSKDPVHDARLHAMLLYRTPQSLQEKFEGRVQNSDNNHFFQVESWLLHHGEKLKNRFHLQAYKLMNHLLKTTDIYRENKNILETLQSEIHLISVATDYFFTADEIKKEYENLKNIGKKVTYHEIKSIHGHDAFLIEYKQLNEILKLIFKQK